ncbi:uncharacterized protein L201_006595 [Kwoniella dendrophila CBS 6074]|uniref:Endoplasmic reticulum-based factor for assembly of V-ATPase n=1 Tax=Kwoniella dendrophila CBS 6074 TaxID=1295534 RepID=A0AAX4K2Q3_9TREE
MATLLTLPPQLLEKIQDLLGHDVDLPKNLREELSRTTSQKSHAINNEDDISVEEPSLWGPQQADKTQDESQDESEDIAKQQVVLVEQPKPLTIPHEIIEDLSRWAGSDKGKKRLGKAGLDPNNYSSIALLAGTEIYIPPNELERLRLAENPDKPNPYIPSYLSSSTSNRTIGLGKEYRKLSKTVSTIFNILFSIFGSSIAVYLACKSSAGYSTELSLLLSILTGLIVGLADGILVYLFNKKVVESRKERHKFGLKFLRGSGKLDENEATDQIDEQEEGKEKLSNEDDVDGQITDLPENENTQASGIKKHIRLRRRGLNDRT